VTLRYRLLSCFLFVLTNVSTLLGQWEWAGGIPLAAYSAVGSAGRVIVVSGAYAGDMTVYSSNAGESWSTSNLGPGLRSFTVAASGSDSVLLAIYGNAVFKSSDHGAIWVKSDSGLGEASLSAVTFSPGAGSTAKGICMASTMSAGVFVSTDAGIHWSPSNSGLTTMRATSVIAIDSTFLIGTADRGIFRSVNNGLTWSPAATGSTDTSISMLATVAGCAFAASGKNVYQSISKGSTWELIPGPLPAAALNLVLVPTPGKGSGAAVFAITDSGYFRLAYDDSMWTPANPSSSIFTGSYTLTAVDASLYAVTRESVFRSNDLGRTWLPVGASLGGGSLVSGRVSSKYDHPSLYAGLFVSTNYGSNWMGMHPISDVSRPTALAVSQDTSQLGYDRLTIGTDSGSVEHSSDGGRTWKILRRADEASRGYQVVGVTELDGIVFASLLHDIYFENLLDSIAGVYRTNDAGGSWEKINSPGLATNQILNVDAFRGKSGGRILFAGGWWHLFRSTNDGVDWMEDTVAPVRTGRKFLREVNGTLFLCTQGTVRVEYLNDGTEVRTNDSARVYRSGDDGVTWNDVTGNLHAAFVRGFAAVALPRYPSRVFLAACTDNAVFTSSEGGKQWEVFSDGLPRFTFGGGVAADTRFVHVGVYGLRRRSWEDAVLTSAQPEAAGHPTMFSLDQNYPNPFNPTTVVRYQLPVASGVKLVVYDVLGREVAVLVNERKEPGTYEVKFDGSGLTSGVYFYRIQAGDPSLRSGQSFMQTRKVLLLK